MKRKSHKQTVNPPLACACCSKQFYGVAAIVRNTNTMLCFPCWERWDSYSFTELTEKQGIPRYAINTGETIAVNAFNDWLQTNKTDKPCKLKRNGLIHERSSKPFYTAMEKNLLKSVGTL